MPEQPYDVDYDNNYNYYDYNNNNYIGLVDHNAVYILDNRHQLVAKLFLACILHTFTLGSPSIPLNNISSLSASILISLVITVESANNHSWVTFNST